MPLDNGTTLGRYRIISLVGKGGMGEVYIAEDTELGREIALKVLLPDVAADADRLRRFVQEARSASALNHPNILTVFDIGNSDGFHYIAAELIDGKTLRDRLGTEQTDLIEALGIARQAASALSAAHAAGILHRDIKPENIMIRRDGLVKVLDFGLAKLTETAGAQSEPEDPTRARFDTHPGMIMGTVAYMSPEQARGHDVDARSDIFSLGIVMYELFTGRRPFSGEGHLDLISSILKDEPEPLRLLSPELPRQLERIVAKTLRKDRTHRYQHIKDLEIDLEDLSDELKFEGKVNKTSPQVLATQVTGPGESRPTLTESISSTRRFTFLHAIVFVAILAGAFGGIWYMRPISVIPGSTPVNAKTAEIASWSSAPGELQSNASFSPDGRMIAFSSTKSGTKNIWVTQTVSSEAIQVTNDDHSNKDPIWSPRGDEIAYFSQSRNAGEGAARFGIWRVSALGGVAKSIGPVEDGSFELRRWTSSGKIYYEASGELYAIDVLSGVKTKVPIPGGDHGKISWVNISPDEGSIAFASFKDGKWQLVTQTLAGTAPVVVASGTGDPLDTVVWLPEKNRFFFSAQINGIFQVFSVSHSAEPIQLTRGESDNIVVDALGDGSSLVLSSAKEESNIWRVDLAEAQEVPVSRTVNAELWPAVSPDGSRIVFQSARNLNRGHNLFNGQILGRTRGGRDDRSVTLVENGFLPAWAPNGSAIAYFRRDERNEVELWAANASGGEARLMASGGIPLIGYSVSPYNYVQAAPYAWSPDSSAIAYISSRSGAHNLWLVSAKDGVQNMLTENTDTTRVVYCPIWSENGSKLAYFSQTRGKDGPAVRTLSVLNVVLRQSVDVFAGERNIRLIGWTHDENGLIIAESENSGSLPPETTLRSISIADGSEQVIARIPNVYFYNIVLSKDRKNIGYAARNDDKDDVWVISAKGGPPRKVTRNNDTDSSISRIAWLNNGSEIFFAKQTRFSLLSLMTNFD